MTGFLDRDKKGSRLAGLLALLSRRKRAVLILSLIPVALVLALSVFSRLSGFSGKGRYSYADLRAAFRAARTGPVAGAGAPIGRAAAPAGAFSDSVEFVRSGEPGVGAADATGALARGVLSQLPPVAMPPGKKAGGASGPSSSRAARAASARAARSIVAAQAAAGGRTYAQLAEASARGGEVYDGNRPSAAVLAVPVGVAAAGPGDSRKTAACAGAMRACMADKAAAMVRARADEDRLREWFGQTAGACGDPCRCEPCLDLQSKISGLCDGDLKAQIRLIGAPCAGPQGCGLGAAAETASASIGAAYCAPGLVRCGCSDFLCRGACLVRRIVK